MLGGLRWKSPQWGTEGSSQRPSNLQEGRQRAGARGFSGREDRELASWHPCCVPGLMLGAGIRDQDEADFLPGETQWGGIHTGRITQCALPETDMCKLLWWAGRSGCGGWLKKDAHLSQVLNDKLLFPRQPEGGSMEKRARERVSTMPGRKVEERQAGLQKEQLEG